MIATICKDDRTVLQDSTIQSGVSSSPDYFKSANLYLDQEEIETFLIGGHAELMDVAPIILLRLIKHIPPGLDSFVHPQTLTSGSCHAEWTPEVEYEQLYEKITTERIRQVDGIEDVKEGLSQLGDFDWSFS